MTAPSGPQTKPSSPTVPIKDVSSLLWGAVTWFGTGDREQDPAGPCPCKQQCLEEDGGE